MAAPKGNKFGTKLKDPKIRQEAFAQYCAWLSQGKPKEAWSFVHPDHSCCYKTIERYIKENPEEFPSIHKEIAHAKGYEAWFQRGVDMVDGKVKNCQPAIYQMIMRNMYDWDRPKAESSDAQQSLMQMIANKWRGNNE